MFFDATTLDASGFCQFPAGRLSRAPVFHPICPPPQSLPRDEKRQSGKVPLPSLYPPHSNTLPRPVVTSYYSTTRTVRRRFKFRVFFCFHLFCFRKHAHAAAELLLLSLQKFVLCARREHVRVSLVAASVRACRAQIS